MTRRQERKKQLRGSLIKSAGYVGQVLLFRIELGHHEINGPLISTVNYIHDFLSLNPRAKYSHLHGIKSQSNGANYTIPATPKAVNIIIFFGKLRL